MKKDGEVLAAEAGGPAATVDVVKAVVEKLGGAEGAEDKLEKAKEHAAEAEDKENGE